MRILQSADFVGISINGQCDTVKHKTGPVEIRTFWFGCSLTRSFDFVDVDHPATAVFTGYSVHI